MVVFGAVLLLSILLWPLTARLPFLGYDWLVYFDPITRYQAALYNVGNYPPWTWLILKPLTVVAPLPAWALLEAITLITLAVAVYREGILNGRPHRYIAVMLALLTPIVGMVLWQGNIIGLVLLGLLVLPAGVPLLLLQPGLAVWALPARWRWIIGAAVFLIVSVLLWGLWPLELWGSVDGRVAHPIAMGWQALGWPVVGVGVLLLRYSHRDPLQLMAVGAFLTPYIMPMHLYLLLPAFGRVRGWRLIVLWLASWLALFPSIFITEWAKYAAMLFPLAVWWFIRPQAIKIDQAAHRGGFSF